MARCSLPATKLRRLIIAVNYHPRALSCSSAFLAPLIAPALRARTAQRAIPTNSGFRVKLRGTLQGAPFLRTVNVWKILVNAHGSCAMPLLQSPRRLPGLPVSRLLHQKETLHTHGCALAQAIRALASSSEKISDFTS